MAPAARLFFGALLFLLASLAGAASRLEIELGALTGPGFALRDVRIEALLAHRQPLRLTIAEMRLGERRFTDLRLSCAASRLTSERIECDGGRLSLLPDLSLRLVHHLDRPESELELAGPGEERWRVLRRDNEIVLRVENGRVERLAPWVSLPVRPTAGRLDGTFVWRQEGREKGTLVVRGRLAGFAFSDAQGLRSAEGMAVSFDAEARRAGGWRIAAAFDWQAGEVFWSPFYFTGQGHRLTLGARFDGQRLELQTATLAVAGVGEVHLSGRWDVHAGVLERLTLSGEELALGPAYALFVKPLAVGRLPAAFDVAGRVRGDLAIEEGRLARFTLGVRDGEVMHEQGLLALKGVEMEVAWRRDASSTGRLAVQGGRLRGLTVGPFAAPLHLAPDGVSVKRLEVPVLDGALVVSNLSVTRAGQAWHAVGEAALRPLSMEALSTALDWPRMHGSVSAVVPRVHWQEGTLAMDGALLLNVFDGTAVVKNLRVEGMAQPVSHAQAEVDMKNIDLDLFTRTFSFGRMEGRVDVVVRDLALVNGRPVRFSASVASSAGDHPRRISQRAVDNIAALGGSSASAALQKTFLRFFEDFRYRRLGLAGRLERNVLTLSGLENRDGGFVIIEGGGIPALTVIGYNREVDWKELVERLARIRQGPSPVIR